MLIKEKVLSIIKDQLPEEFSMDDLFERMSFIASVEKGLEDIEQGRIISEDQLDQEIARWFN